MTHHAADQRLEHGIMRTPKHERIDVAAPKRLEIILRNLLECRADVDLRGSARQIFDRAFAHADTLFDDVYELWRCRGKHRDAGVDMADGARIAFAFHGPLRRDNANTTVLRSGRAAARAPGCTRADHGHREILLRMLKTGGRRRVAGNDEQFDASVKQPVADLLNETVDLFLRARAIRTSCRIAEIDNRFDSAAPRLSLEPP